MKIRQMMKAVSLLLSTILSLSFLQCNQQGNGSGIKMYVTAGSGLVIRSAADISADKLGLAPYGAQVQVYEQSPDPVTIGGKTGHWTKISYNNMEGWSFGAYLSATPPGLQSSVEAAFVNKDLICYCCGVGYPQRFRFFGDQLEITNPEEEPEIFNWSIQNGVLSYGNQKYFAVKNERGLILQYEANKESMDDIYCPDEYSLPAFEEAWEQHQKDMTVGR